MFKMPFGLIVFDLETNRLTQILEIGAVKTDRDLNPISQFTVLVHNQFDNTDHHAIPKDEWEQNRLVQCHALAQFENFVGNKNDTRMASWGTHFDVAVLRRTYEREELDYPFMGTSLCLKSICWATTFATAKPSTTGSLDSLLKRCGMEVTGTRHRALDDAKMALAVFTRVIKGEIKWT